ncbi:uncharacterized protein [Asterias amurensis]|uniref:uncharacterized protein n=1 Tax=Asterias amurensis TaxID=7602 RepID=UPI003AB165E1
MRNDWRSSFSTSYLLVLATFLEICYVTIAESCSYSSFGQVYDYSCLSNQYCCGHGSCCVRNNDYYYGVYDLWYFWFCICFGIFICSVASGAYYRKRQLHTVRVAAVPAGHHGALDGRVHGPYGRGAPQHTHHAPPSGNVFVAATSASGQPVYPFCMYDVPPPNYPVYSTGLGGPVYPAYACNMPPPPAYNTLASDHSEAPNGSSGTAAPPTTGGQDTASFPEVGPPVSS